MVSVNANIFKLKRLLLCIFCLISVHQNKDSFYVKKSPGIQLNPSFFSFWDGLILVSQTKYSHFNSKNLCVNILSLHISYNKDPRKWEKHTGDMVVGGRWGCWPGWESWVGSHRGVVNEGWMTALFSPASSFPSAALSSILKSQDSRLATASVILGGIFAPNRTHNCKKLWVSYILIKPLLICHPRAELVFPDLVDIMELIKRIRRRYRDLILFCWNCLLPVFLPRANMKMIRFNIFLWKSLWNIAGPDRIMALWLNACNCCVKYLLIQFLSLKDLQTGAAALEANMSSSSHSPVSRTAASNLTSNPVSSSTERTPTSSWTVSSDQSSTTTATSSQTPARTETSSQSQSSTEQDSQSPGSTAPASQSATKTAQSNQSQTSPGSASQSQGSTTQTSQSSGRTTQTSQSPTTTAQTSQLTSSSTQSSQSSTITTPDSPTSYSPATSSQSPSITASASQSTGSTTHTSQSPERTTHTSKSPERTTQTSQSSGRITQTSQSRTTTKQVSQPSASPVQANQSQANEAQSVQSPTNAGLPSQSPTITGSASQSTSRTTPSSHSPTSTPKSSQSPTNVQPMYNHSPPTLIAANQSKNSSKTSLHVSSSLTSHIQSNSPPSDQSLTSAVPSNQSSTGSVSPANSVSGVFSPDEHPVNISQLTRQAKEALKSSLRRTPGRFIWMKSKYGS